MTNEEASKIEILDESLKSGFVAMPRIVLRAPQISIQAKAVYSLLLDYAWQDGKCFPGQDTLAKDLNVHRNTIQRHLIELRNIGLISWKRRGLNKSNIYFIHKLESVLPCKSTDAPPVVHQDSQPMMQQDAPSTMQVLETDYYKQNTYKQLLTTNENLNNSTFGKEAIELSKELKDEKNIRYYQSVVNKKKNGELTDDDIQTALNQTRKALSESIHDGTKFLHNAGAWFTACLKKLEYSRKEDNKLNKFSELKNSLLEKKKMK